MFLTRFLDCWRKPGPEPITPVQPRVRPDPQHAAELERRRAGLAYQPDNPFHKDTLQEKFG
jgi:hypothetical protein